MTDGSAKLAAEPPPVPSLIVRPPRHARLASIFGSLQVVVGIAACIAFDGPGRWIFLMVGVLGIAHPVLYLLRSVTVTAELVVVGLGRWQSVYRSADVLEMLTLKRPIGIETEQMVQVHGAIRSLQAAT
ncbi:MAG: hypothetical protein AAF567_04505 [Actinomycetota bacterium]